MKIKKFMLYNLIGSFIFLGLIFFFSFIYNKFMNLETKKYYYYDRINSKKVRITSVGSSHTYYGIFFNKNCNYINLAKSAQNFYYDLKVLEKYQSKMEQEAIILIPVSIQSFYSSDNKEIDKGYINILSKKEIKNINLIEYLLERNFSILFPPSKIINFMKKNKNDDNFYPKDLKEKERRNESIETVKIHLGINRTELKDYSLKNAEEDFINLINYIESKNWKYVLITTPFSYLYNENIEKYQKGAFKERIYDNIKEVEKRLEKKFVYLDYSHDSRFENNLEYFFDDDHLNEKGAKYFTEILLEDLKKLGYNID